MEESAGDSSQGLVGGEMDTKPALQVIVLGPEGGPREDRVTSLLVRSMSSNWSARSVVAVDAGSLICPIIRALEAETQPFKGLELPQTSSPANAAHILREIIGSILLTHPHLDHISGFTINTPLLEAGSEPKVVVGLEPMINAIKTHIFNDLIWPNLSDEDGGVGLVTYHRLTEGGNPLMGRGVEKGYSRVAEGLMVKCFGVSHGKHRRKDPALETEAPRRMSVSYPPPRPADAAPPAGYVPMGYQADPEVTIESSAFFILDHQTSREVLIFGDVEPDTLSKTPRNKAVWEVAAPKIAAGDLRAIFIECSYDDNAEDDTLFGHLCPRHLTQELATLAALVVKIKTPHNQKRKRASAPDAIEGGETHDTKKRTKAGLLATALTQGTHAKSLSMADKESQSQPASPRAGSRSSPRRRNGGGNAARDSPSDDDYDPTETRLVPPVAASSRLSRESTPRSVGFAEDEKTPRPESEEPPQIPWEEGTFPLRGLQVFIIHVKDDMNGGQHPRERILAQLNARAEEYGLGCEFKTPDCSASIEI